MNAIDSEMEFYQRRNKTLISILFFTILLMIVAIIPGIGYEATANANPRGVIGGIGLSEGTYSLGRLCSGTLNVSFNPLLYPISYVSGRSSVFRKYQGAAELWDYEGQQVAEAATIGTIFIEFMKNLPYFLGAGCLITLALLKVNKSIKIETKPAFLKYFRT